ncbi:MAG: hypothetical protein NC311_06145 [Muribaculaceae bacterium]|nr:hypothetical protein [Muribaculaceae bacterium]
MTKSLATATHHTVIARSWHLLRKRNCDNDVAIKSINAICHFIYRLPRHDGLAMTMVAMDDGRHRHDSVPT